MTGFTDNLSNIPNVVKKSVILLFLCCMILCLHWLGCKVDPSFEVSPSGADVSFYIPEGWPKPVYQFEGNPLTKDGFELGRKLFYDVRLSRDNTVSCGTCHQQFAAFANLDHAQSHGIDGKFGIRNAQGLFNLNWHPDLFWDGRVSDLVHQPLRPIADPVEMDEKVEYIIEQLNSDATYRNMFRLAFGSETATTDNMLKALAQFMGAMISDDSKYDRHIRGENGGSLTAAESNGLSLFRTHCASCHKEPLFTDFSFRNNGLTPDPAFNDKGRAGVTGKDEDNYRFKVPSLRNVGATRPYMHDGRFETLDQVLEHYRNGIHSAPNLDTLLTTGISLTDTEKQDIISFLHTLTDYTFIKDERFAQP